MTIRKIHGTGSNLTFCFLGLHPHGPDFGPCTSWHFTFSWCMLRHEKKTTRIGRLRTVSTCGRFVPANKFCSRVLVILKQWRNDSAVRQNSYETLSQPTTSRHVMGHGIHLQNVSSLTFPKSPCQAEKQDIHNKRGIQKSLLL